MLGVCDIEVELTLNVVGPRIEMGESHTQPCSVTLLIHFAREQSKATKVLSLTGMEVRIGCILLGAARLEFTPPAQETRNTRHELAQPSLGLAASAWRPT